MPRHTETHPKDAAADSSLYLHILLPALASIIVVTAVTVEVSEPFLDRPLARRIAQTDVIYNLLLYLPLGAALSRHKLIKALAIAGGLSLVAESVQLFYPDRVPSAIDVGVNTLGAFIGLLVARLTMRFLRLDLTAIKLGALTALLSFSAYAALVYAMWPPDPGRWTFSNWDPTFQIAIGNELSQDRLWHGEVSGVAILAEPLDVTHIKALHRGGPESLRNQSVSDLPPALFAMSEPLSESDSLWGLPLLGVERTHPIFDGLVEKSRLSALVWFRSFEPNPSGPARILTYSKDPLNRNFTIALEDRRIVFRLRTPKTGPNGVYPQVVTAGFVDANEDVFVAATYDGRVSRVYIDGRLAARLSLAARSWISPFLADSGLPTTGVLAGMLSAVGLLSLGGRRIRHRRQLVATLAGLAGAAIIAMLVWNSPVPELIRWLPLVGFLAGAIVGASAAPRRP